MGNGTFQIRWHGRGGQGAKTAAAMVAEVAVEAGKYAQGAPEYGAEREGAPIKAYTRISETPIRVHDAIHYPNVVIVLDETLLVSESVEEGLTEDGVLLVNTVTPATSCNSGSIVDKVAYGTGSCGEGGTVNAPIANNSILRLPGGACGNGTDTNSNAADFVSQSPSTPRNSTSTPQP